MSRWDAILLDFDDTIAETSPFQHLRQARKWADYFGAVAKAQSITPTGWRRPLIAEVIDSRIPWAVVTSSPSTAVRRFFQARSGWEAMPQVLVGYHDTGQHKPHPEPLLKALNQLKVEPSLRVLSIGDQPEDTVAAIKAGITAGTTSQEAFSNVLPDVFIHKPEGLLSPEGAHKLATAWDRPGTTYGYLQLKGKHPGVPLLIGGRYDVDGGTLSDLIHQSKDAPPWPEPLVDLATRLVGEFRAPGRSVMVTTIPPRAGGPDRWEQLRSALTERLGVAAAPLLWARETDSQRKVHTADRRRQNMEAAFKFGVVEPGSIVIVVDDVRTTGATLAAAAVAVQSSGGSAHLVALTQTFRPAYASSNRGNLGALLPNLKEVSLRAHQERSPAHGWCQRIGCRRIVKWSEPFCGQHTVAKPTMTAQRSATKKLPGERLQCAACGEDYPARWAMCGYCGNRTPSS